MKTIKTILIALALLVACMQAFAQEENPGPPDGTLPAPPPAPMMPGPPDRPTPPTAPAPQMPQMMRGREIAIGPTDSMSNPKKVRGKVNAVAFPPPTVEVASVEIFFNNALIGQASTKPYKVEFNTATVSAGVHQFKAVGLDANRKQIWTASTAIEIPAASNAASQISAKPVIPSASPSALNNRSRQNTPDSPPNASISPAQTLAKTYSSSKYHFDVQYPAGWIAKDKTSAMKPSKPGNAWVSFAQSAKSPKTVINVRRMRVDNTTNADEFAKYNSYVSSWERKTVLGEQAFATTSGTPESKKVIHRLIIIKNGCAWMLNCVDTSGDSPDKSRSLFDSIVGSLVIKNNQQAPAVTITEKGNKH